MSQDTSSTALRKWKTCLQAIKACAEVACMCTNRKDGSVDIVFPDIDGDSYDDPKSHWQSGAIVAIKIPSVFNMRNEIFTADLDRVRIALSKVDGVTLTEGDDEIIVKLEDQPPLA